MQSIDDATTTRYWSTAVLVVAPAVLFAALVAHPYLGGRLPNDEAIAEAVASGPRRWALVHLATGVASALIAVAFLAARSYLRRAGEDRFSALGMPFVIVGSTLFAVLPGMEFVPLAVAETGGTTAEIAAAQDEIARWFTLVLVVGGLAFAIGVFSFATAISVSGVGSVALTRVVIAALAVMAMSRFVPLAAVQFYVQSVATTVALWPIAYAVWTQPMPSTVATHTSE